MIGLIFGESKLTFEILKKVKKKKIEYLIIDLTKKKVFKKNKFAYPVSVGQFGKIIKILKLNRCKKVLFAGKVKKPNFSKLRLDFKGIYYIPRIIKSSKIGDVAILKEIIKILKQQKINTIDSLSFNKDLALKKGNYSIVKPNKLDKIDIKKAIKVLKEENQYNYSQGAVIRNKKVIAIEDDGGTDKMLKKCKNNKFKNRGVLIKFPKGKQDLRIDLPTVGIKTFYQCRAAGIKGVVLKSQNNIFLEKYKCIKFANKNKMFITSI